MSGYLWKSRLIGALASGMAIAIPALVLSPSPSTATTMPSVGIGSASMREGNMGTRVLRLAVTLSARSSNSVSVKYAPASGTATAGSDFISASGTVTIPAGSMSRWVSVTIIGDTTTEPTESFRVSLSSSVNATISGPTGTGIITNDDPSSGTQLTIGSVWQPEGDSGLRTVWFPVSLSTASAAPVSVHYATASGTATAGSDFTSTSGTLTVPIGQTTGYVPVTIAGDTTFETSETFKVNISSAVGATLANTTGVGTIVNDDAGTCGVSAAPPAHYTSVVVFAFENRTWSQVGGVGFGTGMPYMHSLAQRCSYFTNWTETDTTQSSETQYVGEITGARQPGTQGDCQPSTTCSTQADNLFRQARRAGIRAINYVEDATTGCSDTGDPRRTPTIPDLFMWGSDDRSFCVDQVRPYSEFSTGALPNFVFVTPTMCDNGHDCSNATADDWARANVQPVLDTAAYKAGKVAVFLWWDENTPVPNLWITPTARSGAQSLSGAGYAGTLKAWESMLGLPCLANACTAPNMRAAANS